MFLGKNNSVFYSADITTLSENTSYLYTVDKNIPPSLSSPKLYTGNPPFSEIYWNICNDRPNVATAHLLMHNTLPCYTFYMDKFMLFFFVNHVQYFLKLVAFPR